jgi:hypothetical protein
VYWLGDSRQVTPHQRLRLSSDRNNAAALPARKVAKDCRLAIDYSKADRMVRESLPKYLIPAKREISITMIDGAKKWSAFEVELSYKTLTFQT